MIDSLGVLYVIITPLFGLFALICAMYYDFEAKLFLFTPLNYSSILNVSICIYFHSYIIFSFSSSFFLLFSPLTDFLNIAKTAVKI